jgi:hypothetical protein
LSIYSSKKLDFSFEKIDIFFRAQRRGGHYIVLTFLFS